MDNKLTLNVDTIICAELKDETLSRDWVWGEETRKEWSWRKFKFVKTYVEGFYDSWDMIYDRIYYSKEQLEHKNNVIVDGKADTTSRTSCPASIGLKSTFLLKVI